MELWHTGVGNIHPETVIYIREDGFAVFWEYIHRGMPWAICTLLYVFTTALCIFALVGFQRKKIRTKIE